MPPYWQRELARRIKARREALGLDLRQLASTVRMYWIELDRYERAEQVPTLDRLYLLAKALETDLHDLLPADGEEPDTSA